MSTHASTASGQQTAYTRRGLLQRGMALGAVGAVPGLLAACGSNGGGAASAAPQSIRFLVGEAFWTDWNPYGHFSQVQFGLQRNIFDRLVEVTPKLDIEAGIADSWKQIDARTWEFSLKRGLKFHDGQPLTAKDVKASIELASGASKLGKEHTTISLMWGTPHEVEVVDDATVRIHSKTPFGPLLNTLALTDIVSVADVGGGPKGLGKRPNGTGAFRLSDDGANRKGLAPFAGHYKPARLKDLAVEYIPDTQTRLNALLARQAQVISRVRPDQIDLIERRDGFRALSETSLEVQTLWLLKNKPPFDNVHARRALAWGIDREAVAKLVGGSTAAARSHLAPGIQYSQPQEPRYGFDPAKARAELEQAGLTLPVSIEFVGSVGGYPKSKEAAELMTRQLKDAGFEVKLEVLESAAFNERASGDNPPNVFYSGWGNLTRDPDFAVSLPFRSPGAVTPEDSKETDRLIDLGKATPDGDERAEVYAKLQRHLWNELPTVPVIFSDTSQALTDDVTGFENYPTFVFNFQPVQRSAS